MPRYRIGQAPELLGVSTDTRAPVGRQLQSGPHRFVALITREAADELELAPGMIADAVVKATNVGVEVPAAS